MRAFPKRSMLMLVAALCIFSYNIPAAQDALETGFSNPPVSAKPHTWWHWMNGNVTREGITADLEAMKSAGLGGAQIFHVAEHIPAGPVGYMTAQWREMVKHAVKEADRLGLELCMHNCPGWSSSAGPWIDPAHAMQVIAWSDKQVHGPVHLSEQLPAAKAPQVTKPVDYYRDIAVLAFPVSQRADKPEAIKKLLGKTGVTRQNVGDPDPETTAGKPAIAAKEILVLTDKLDASGTLTWDVPPGDWVILRIAYTPTGAKNKAAPPEGLGLEVDKLSREALDVHWNGMMAKVIEDLGPLAGKVLNNALIDSYEVGDQNWSPKFREEFQKRRGYDLLKYLPVITGRTVESSEVSERFLWDFRRTIADLYADNYYGYFRDLCHRHGLQFSTEPYGNGGFDNLQCGGVADIPMGEFWVGGHYMKSAKLASSAAHLNARKFVGAESFTASLAAGKYQLEPYAVKALGDLAFCNGINRYVFHRYAHQPWLNIEPGMTMGKWGMHLERTITWWNEASAWFKYIARCQYLLQEGRFVADVLYFEGEGAPNDLPERNDLRPPLPDGYDYDGCDITALMDRVSVKDGRIVLPDRMSYRLLVMPDSKYMTLRVAEKVRELVRSGATVIGRKPEHSPSLSGYPESDNKVRQIAAELWGNVDGAANKVHEYGSGRIIWGKSLEEVFAQLKSAPDFEYHVISSSGKLGYIHRQIGDADVYFVSNQLYMPVTADCTFRVNGRAPEMWHADTGEMEPVPVYRQEAGRTTIPLRLDPAESVFVVFRHSAADHLEQLELVSETSDTTTRVAIRKATYETTDGLKSLDVTKKVADMVSEGNYDISATSELLGEPMRGAVKQLRLDYVLDGKAMSTVVGDREVFHLTDIARRVTFPKYEVSKSTSGTNILIAWQPGRFDYRMSNGSTQTLQVKQPASTLQVSTPWTVHFQAARGAPDSLQMEQLASWTESAEAGVRYFSGSADYEAEFDMPPAIAGSSRKTILDLGVVKNFATVRLNGKELGILWKAPFRVNVTDAVKPGRNHLEVKITNLWTNRLIGDEQLPEDVQWKNDSLVAWPDWLLHNKPRPSGRIAFSTWHFYDKNSPLLESGLIGPVLLHSAERVPLQEN